MIYYKGIPINELSKEEKIEYDNLCPIPPHGDYMGSPHLFNGEKYQPIKFIKKMKYIIAILFALLQTIICFYIHTSEYWNGVSTMIVYFNAIKFIENI